MTLCKKCGLPIIEVESHSSEDCAIEGTMWMHDAESVPDGIDPCAAYDADDDHEGIPAPPESELSATDVSSKSPSGDDDVSGAERFAP